MDTRAEWVEVVGVTEECCCKEPVGDSVERRGGRGSVKSGQCVDARVDDVRYARVRSSVLCLIRLCCASELPGFSNLSIRSRNVGNKVAEIGGIKFRRGEVTLRNPARRGV